MIFRNSDFLNFIF